MRTRCDEVSIQGRNTQGMRVIKLKADEQLVGLARIEEPAEDEEQDPTDDTP